MSDIDNGTLNPRRAAAWAVHLPPGAAVYRSEGSDLAWSDAEHILAITAHQIAAGNWQRGGGKGKSPKPLPTPAEIQADEKRKERDRQNAVAYIERQKQRKRELRDGKG